MTARMTILRALPGAGKTTFVSPLEAQGWAVASADRFPGLYGVDAETGAPTIDVAKLDPAHGASYLTAIEALQRGQNVIVDNTNLTVEEVGPYVAIAQAFRADVDIVTIVVDPETAFARNTHGVPRSVFFGSPEHPERGSMTSRFEAFKAPFHWQFLPWLSTRLVTA